MKKIDFHIHTKKTVSDENIDFNFSLDVLKKYIETNDLDGIAITNHNHFDLDQFIEINKNISINFFLVRRIVHEPTSTPVFLSFICGTLPQHGI